MPKLLLQILLVLFPVQLASSLARADNYANQFEVRHITADDGLPGNTIHDIVQDRDGFLWMAGTGGLARYDGYRFVQFYSPGLIGTPGIVEHFGRLLLSPSGDQLWASTATFNQRCYDLGMGRFVDYTGHGDLDRPYRRENYLKSGLWMWSNTEGVRHVSKTATGYVTRDYTQENGALPDDYAHSLDEDGEGNVWVATDKGLVRIDRQGKPRTVIRGETFLGCYAYGDKIMTFSKKGQTAYIYSSNGRLLRKSMLPAAMGHIGTIRDVFTWQGKWVIIAGSATFTLDKSAYRFEKPADSQIPNGFVMGHVGGRWFAANQSSGSVLMFMDKGGVKRLDLVANPVGTRDRNSVFCVTQGKDGTFYIGSYGNGLFVYNDKDGIVGHYTVEDRNPIIFSNYVILVTTDRSGCVWVSTNEGGVSCLTPADKMARYYLIDDNRQGDMTNAFYKILSAGKDRLSVETKDNKVYDFSLSGHAFSDGTPVSNQIWKVFTDSRGHRWTATRGNGLWIDGKQAKVTADGKQLDSGDFTSVVEDNLKRVWLGTWNRGLLLVIKTNGNNVATRSILGSNYKDLRVNGMSVAKDGCLFVATYRGLVAIDARKTNLSSRDLRVYHTGGGNFPADEVTSVCPSTDGIVWVGTVGGGLVRCDFSKGIGDMRYDILTVRDGMSNNNIRTLVLDRRGMLWAGTDNGLSRLDDKARYIRRYKFSDKVLGNTFSMNCSSLLPDGRLAFGTSFGLLIVNPALDSRDNMKTLPQAPLISDIRINGNSIYEGLDTVVLDKSLALSSKVSLKYRQNSLTFFFSSCDYHDIESQAYQYYLEGIDDGWRDVTGESHAEYTNLSPGNYVFHVRTVSQNGAGKETALKVHIGEPWYNTIWAWLIYIIIICVVAYYLWRNARERFMMHQQMKLDKQVAEFRTDFFTHVTHEFRTPLAILQNAVARLADPGGNTRKNIQTAQRGIRRLLRLVNQFLEYRRLETGKLPLQVQDGDIVDFVKDIYLDFSAMASQKNITMTFVPFKLHYDVAFDHSIVESVVYNLISNAVKYTPQNGAVAVQVQDNAESGTLKITVEDTGTGITGEQRENLFRPFMEGHVSKGGMGIGLYTSFRMAKVHHGSLDYSDATPHGARFTFSLPDNSEGYSVEEFSQATTSRKNTDDDAHYEEIIREMAPKALNSQTVAIVEDDPDMQEQIAGEVGNYFHTVAYSDGTSAVEGIKETKPSLILCDIMLPDMDGYQVVTKVKAANELRDIPVIMLTALDDERHQIKGYQVGADDYMVKPCNYHLLIARMMQLIKWHEKRQEKPAKAEPQPDTATQEVNDIDTSAKVSGAGTIITSRADKRFCEQLEAVVSHHLDDTTLSVDRLAEMMSMGRTKFYGKVKDLFGMSPNKYLQSRRLQEAAKLLDEGTYSVAEVGYKVGFSDPSYFNRSFKAHFGILPGKYKNR